MPTYLAMGMTADEYWNGDPYLAVMYQKRQELINAQKNSDAWWQGFYVYDAISTTVHNILRKRGQKMQTYPQKPYDLSPKSKEVDRRKAEAERKKAVDYFNDLQTRMKKKYG